MLETIREYAQICLHDAERAAPRGPGLRTPCAPGSRGRRGRTSWWSRVPPPSGSRSRRARTGARAPGPRASRPAVRRGRRWRSTASWRGAPTRGSTARDCWTCRELRAVAGRTVALVGAPGGRELLATTLAARGARVLPVAVYRREPPAGPRASARRSQRRRAARTGSCRAWKRCVPCAQRRYRGAVAPARARPSARRQRARRGGARGPGRASRGRRRIGAAAGIRGGAAFLGAPCTPSASIRDDCCIDTMSEETPVPVPRSHPAAAARRGHRPDPRGDRERRRRL